MAEKMPLTSEDIRAERITRLREDFPEVFTEGKVDFERLKQVLGEEVVEGRERYGLSWAGKSEAVRNIQTPSVATLVPDREESVEFDATENLFIEGDNLEVLKLLQKGYHGQVKMIYIDPPYNTGNEFIYPDNFREGIDDYLRYSGQVSDGGIKLSTNTETGGRYHSNWLNMMYPRLFLARNLLREDGVIFVSIDDHEVHNLRLLMDEIFGPENFVASVIWQKVFSPKNTAQFFSVDHDYVVVYARDLNTWKPNLLPRSEEADKRYTNPDDDARGPWSSSDLTARNYYSKGQYEVIGPTGKTFGPGVGRYWGIDYDQFQNLDRDERIYWGSAGTNMPRLKRYLSEVKQGVVAQTLWFYKDVGHTQDAKKELLAHVDIDANENVLNSVKPTELIEKMLRISTDADSGDIVVDFFAGSAPTAHATLRLNQEEGGNRQFVCVQLPEQLPKPDSTLKSIADMGKERIRRVIKKLNDEENGKLKAEDEPPQDRGLKVFRLTSSNFKIWHGAEASEEPEDLAEQLRAFAENVDPDRSREDILYEILLKSGLPLTAEVERLEVAGREVYAVSGGLLMVCLADHVDEELLRAVVEHEPERFVCLDTAFDGNDKLKTNSVLQMKDHGIEFRTV
jgi:adenine-specific DNA-methyltransferase